MAAPSRFVHPGLLRRRRAFLRRGRFVARDGLLARLARFLFGFEARRLARFFGAGLLARRLARFFGGFAARLARFLFGLLARFFAFFFVAMRGPLFFGDPGFSTLMRSPIR
jgi:hypothetical protein